MKFEIEIVETRDLPVNKIKKINSLKNQHWKHSEIDHMRWFEDNMRKDDLHLIIWENDYRPIAYLNIVHIDATINTTHNRMMGIGNVCVDRQMRNLGIGSILMASANMAIKKKRSCGLLLCHDRLTDFYEANGWMVMNLKRLEVAGKKFTLKLMAYDPFHLMADQIVYFAVDRNF